MTKPANERDYLRQLGARPARTKGKPVVNPTSIYIPPKLIHRTSQAAKDYGVSRNALIRRAIAVYLDVLDGLAEVHHLEK